MRPKTKDPAVQLCFRCLVSFQRIKIFQEKKPRTLFCIIKLAGATGIFPENIVNIFEGFFKHE